MNYFQKIVSTIASVKSGSWDSAFLKNLDTKYFGDQIDTKPYKISQLVYVCISTTARAISQVPLMVMKPATEPKRRSVKALDFKSFANLKAMSFRSDSVSEKMIDKAIKNGELEPVESNNPWQMLLDNPNPYMDGSIFKYSLIGHILLDGNVWMVPFPPSSKLPLQIWVVAKESMEADTDKTNGHLNSWKYRPRGLQFSVDLKPEEVNHLRLWSPYDQIFGQAPLEAGKIDIRTDYKASVYNENFFDDGAVPEGIVYTEKKIGQDKKDRTQEAIEGRHRGYRKSHRLMLLDQALKYQRIGLSQEEMNFKDLKFHSAAAVMQCFGMKKAVLSVTDDLNYATAKEQKKSWWEDSNLPLMRMISNSLNSRTFSNLPYIVWWDKSSVEALREDYDKKVDTATKLWRMGKSFEKVNDMLELGFEAEDSDKIAYVPGAFKPVAEDGTLIPEPEPVQIPINSPLAIEETPKLLKHDVFSFAKGGGIIEDGFKPEEVLPLTRTSSVDLGVQLSYVDKKFEEKGEAIWSQLQDDMARLQTTFESKIKRVLFEMRKSVIGMANGQRYEDQKTVSKVSPSPQQLIHDIDGVNFMREKDLLEKLTKSLYEKSAALGAQSVGSELGLSISFDIIDPIVLQYISVRRLKVKGVLDTVKRQLRAGIHDGMQSGESIDQIASRIRSIFNMSEARAQTIARTEVIGTTNFGRYSQLQHTAYTRKIWFTARDERVRPSHGLLHGRTVEMNKSWTFDDGTTVRYPGDYMGKASQVINCRCIEVVDPESFNPELLGPIQQTDINNLGNREE